MRCHSLVTRVGVMWFRIGTSVRFDAAPEVCYIECMLKIAVILVSLSLSISAFAEDLGLCYDSQLKQTRLQTGPATPPLTSIPRDVRHNLAMKASQLVYKLSDLETSKSGAELVSKFANFRSQALPDYQAWRYASDRASGLKYAVFAPNNPEDPWIFAFAGTESALDWMSDISLGRLQLRTVEDLTSYFTDCRNVDRFGVPIAARNWIITGHSLGGGLAQAFGFKSRARRLVHRMVPGRLELVTFNGFGALDLVGSFASFANTETMQMQTANYFVTGDVVSRIGRHIGETFEIPLPRGVRGGALQSHLMTTVEASVMSEGYPRFDRFQRASPPASQALQVLKSVGSRLEFLTEISTDKLTTQMEQARVLREAVDIVLKRQMSGPYDREVLAYIREITTGFIAFLKQKPQHVLRDQLIDDLSRLRARTVSVNLR